MKFFGLTVKDFKSSIGYGNQSSQMNISLVQDTVMGDIPNIPPIGSPAYFQFGNYKFFGILQSSRKNIGTDGEFYEIVLTDPREVLDGVQIFTSDYNGSVLGLYNVINVYSFYEDAFFGSSSSNDSGMPWDKVLFALLSICNTPIYTRYGGPVNFGGFAYSLDLSELPIPPVYYKIPAGFVSLLEIINQICTDCACDYFFELIGFTIKLRTINRTFAPPLGTVSAIVNSSKASGLLINASIGLELRNENTGAMVIGAPKTGISLSNSFTSYWGTDIFGNPIIGIAGVHNDFGACEYMNINAMDCADIIGSVYYPTNTIEMRAALSGPESWNLYLKTYRPNILAFIGKELYGPKTIPFAPNFKQDIVDDSAANVQEALDSILKSRRERLFDLVKSHAEDFYGRQFLVQIPFVLANRDLETLELKTTLEPVSSGYLAGGAAALGAPGNRLDVIQDADERVLPFAFFNTILNSDTSRINWSDVAITNNGAAFVKVQMEERIVFLNAPIPVPTVLVKLGSSFYTRNFDEFSDTNKLIFGPNLAGQAAIIDAKSAAGGTIGTLNLYPAAYYPSIFGIPLKSNIETYGPWVIQGSAGKMRIEQDSSLNPWDYGSETLMNLAGQSRVISAISSAQIMESGEVNLAGAPNFSLGDVMQANGPNITAINVSYSVSGISSSYRFDSYTPRFGIFSKQNVERLRTIALTQVQQRKETRKLLNKAIVAKSVINKAAKGAKFNKAFWQKKTSPHTVLMAQSFVDGASVRTGASTEQYESALVLCAGEDDYTNKALMSLSGLVRGISTKSTGSSFGSFQSPSSTAGGLTNTSLNPFRTGNDIELLSWGDTYAGAHAYHRGNDSANTRALGLRGPIVITGWGYGIDLKEYPNNGGNTFHPEAFRRGDLWPTGSVDLLWDNGRKVWTSHDIFRGDVVGGSVASGATGNIVPNGYSITIPFINTSGRTLSLNEEILIGYVANENKFVILCSLCSLQPTDNFLTYVHDINCSPTGRGFIKTFRTVNTRTWEITNSLQVDMGCCNCNTSGSLSGSVSGSAAPSGGSGSGGGGSGGGSVPTASLYYQTDSGGGGLGGE